MRTERDAERIAAAAAFVSGSVDGTHLRPPATTRAARRAEAMGFDTSTIWYHGTDKAFSEFSLNTAGQNTGDGDPVPAIWLTDNRGRASGFAAGGGPVVREGAQVLPVYIRPENMEIWDMGGASITGARERINEALAEAYANGMAGVIFEDLVDTVRPVAAGGPARGAKVVAVFDPADVRSVQAEFDPEQVGSADLLAAMGGRPAVSARRTTVR